MQVTARKLTLGKDPELSFTKNGNTIVKFTAAENINRKKEDGTWETVRTDWYHCMAYDTVAEELSALGKGMSIKLYEGNLEFYQYEDKDGNQREGMSVIIRDFKILPKLEAQQ